MCVISRSKTGTPAYKEWAEAKKPVEETEKEHPAEKGGKQGERAVPDAGKGSWHKKMVLVKNVECELLTNSGFFEKKKTRMKERKVSLEV